MALEIYGVWAQTITNDTTAANVEKYGEIEDMAEAYRDGFAKDFCDGQTSPTPPRWPDDGMQLLYFYDRESAELVSQFLRGDIDDRIAGGMLSPIETPTWSLNNALLRLISATDHDAMYETAAGDRLHIWNTDIAAGIDPNKEADLYRQLIETQRMGLADGQNASWLGRYLGPDNYNRVRAGMSRSMGLQLRLFDETASMGGIATAGETSFTVRAAAYTQSGAEYRAIFGNSQVQGSLLDGMRVTSHEMLHAAGMLEENITVDQVFAAATHLRDGLQHDHLNMVGDVVEHFWYRSEPEARAALEYLQRSNPSAFNAFLAREGYPPL